MLLKTRGIVFRAVKFGETSVIADIFTEEKGLHSFVAGSVRTAKSRMPFNLFQPMSIVDMVSYYRDDSGALNRLRELRADFVFGSIPFDIRKGAVTLFLAEICQKSIHEADENRPMFEFLLNTIVFLDATRQPIANIHLHFMLELSAFLGFRPSEEPASGEVFFDLREGIFRSTAPFHPHFLEPEETGRLLALLRAPIQDCHTVTMTRAERKSLLSHLLKFYQLHVPGFSEVHAPDVLEVVLDT